MSIQPRPLLIVYTSGTTGHPKGAVLRQEALVWNAVMSQHMHDMTAQDHVLTVLPLFHVGGLNIQTTPALQLGATVTLHARFAPDATLEAIARDRPTLTVLVPATIQAVIEHPRWAETELDSLRAVTTGSTQVPQRLVDAFTERGVPVLQVYGSTETCPIAVYTRLAGDWRRPGLDGPAGPGVRGARRRRRRQRGAGRHAPARSWCAARTCSSNTGAMRRPPPRRCARAGTTRGDIGTRDADGHFFIHDRKKNMIISGGENIYPAEVERVLGQHPAVAEAAVIGRADDRWQEVPVAYVVPRAGRDAVSPPRSSAFAWPSWRATRCRASTCSCDSLPRNAMGKVQHFRLRELIAERGRSAAQANGAEGG